MKKIIALILAVVFCSLIFTACRKEKLFEGDYKEMTVQDAETLKPVITQNLSQQATNELYKNFRLSYSWKIGQISRSSNLLYSSDGGDVRLSFVMNYSNGSSGKIEYYIKDGYFYVVSEGAQREVVKTPLSNFEVTELFGLMLFKRAQLIDVNFDNFDLSASAQDGYKVLLAHSAGKYKLQITITEQAFKKKNSVYAPIGDFNYEAFFAFEEESFSGAKIDISYNVLSSPIIPVAYKMELYPLSEDISFPGYITES